MGVYVVTGGSGGIGAQIINLLRRAGHETINVDVKDGDTKCGDLASKEGRMAVIEEIKSRCPDGFDGLVLNAGVNASCGNLSLIVSLNFYGCTVLTTGLWDLLEKKSGSVVITSSNSINQGKGTDLAQLLASGIDEAIAHNMLKNYDSKNPSAGHEVYVATKYAQALWLRRMSSTSAARGVRVNGVAPGNIRTPMTTGLNEAAKEAVNALPIPTKFGGESLQEPEEIARVICFLLSKDSIGINGDIIFADGGTDALLRPDSVC